MRRSLTRCAPRAHTLAFAFAIFALSFSSLAFAGEVTLRGDLGVANGRLTLGDVFEGAGPASRVVVATGAPGTNLVLDAGRLQMIARSNGLEWSNPQGLRRVIARADGGAVAGPVAGNRTVLLYARSLAAGEIVQPEDLVWGKAAGAPADAPRDADAVIGKAAKRPLREGAAAAMRDVSAPQVIKAGDVVSVAFDEDGIRLVLQAKAMNGAAVGDALSVINPASKKVVQVVATGPGEAAVGASADLARSQKFASLR